MKIAKANTSPCSERNLTKLYLKEEIEIVDWREKGSEFQRTTELGTKECKK